MPAKSVPLRTATSLPDLTTAATARTTTADTLIKRDLARTLESALVSLYFLLATRFFFFEYPLRGSICGRYPRSVDYTPHTVSS